MSDHQFETICMWSGPRNLSTAMMRSFENRADTAVWDEPFFAPWLKASGKVHPGREETLARHESDPEIVSRMCLERPPNNNFYFFQKHMPHHMLEEFPLEWTQSCKHFFLIRRPDAVIASYVKERAEFDIDDIGFFPLIRLYDWLSSQGHILPIVDCDDILANPEVTLSVLCKNLGMPFDQAMLSWPAGPRATDGAWAPWWYKSVESSTGFAAPKTENPVVPQKYHDILEKCQPAYEKLYAQRLRT